MIGMNAQNLARILTTTLSGVLALGLALATPALALDQPHDATATASPATTTFTTLATFTGPNGKDPGLLESLVQGLDGNFYGTTTEGGANKVCLDEESGKDVGCGTVFKVTPGGTVTVLHSFDKTDGSFPLTGLVLGSNGNFYGVTSAGGGDADGTVFEITPGGTLTTLVHFDGTNGRAPLVPLVQGSNGNFYGATSTGGANGDGTVFEITPAGTLTTLHSFCSLAKCADGEDPNGLIQAANGNLYGTTYTGGVNSSCPTDAPLTESGCGTVFKITPGGTLTTLLSFGGTNGALPNATLVQATNGNFYGTTDLGGTFCLDDGGCGTIFEITPGGTLTTLLDCNGTDCSQPFPGLIQASDGNFYGTTEAGGANPGCGIIFEIAGGTLTTLVNFGSGTISSCDPGGLVQGTDGNFYGTTVIGNGGGTVFSLAVGLGPFVEANPTSGNAGTAVTILGNNLTGSTSVTFNGVQATFNVVSSTEITTTVPNGAITGKVQVTTPTGTLSSNVNFQVP
jgi:uncharacterized repeat protein (TIGR03803 family)